MITACIQHIITSHDSKAKDIILEQPQVSYGALLDIQLQEDNWGYVKIVVCIAIKIFSCIPIIGEYLVLPVLRSVSPTKPEKAASALAPAEGAGAAALAAVARAEAAEALAAVARAEAAEALAVGAVAGTVQTEGLKGSEAPVSVRLNRQDFGAGGCNACLLVSIIQKKLEQREAIALRTRIAENICSVITRLGPESESMVQANVEDRLIQASWIDFLFFITQGFDMNFNPELGATVQERQNHRKAYNEYLKEQHLDGHTEFMPLFYNSDLHKKMQEINLRKEVLVQTLTVEYANKESDEFRSGYAKIDDDTRRATYNLFTTSRIKGLEGGTVLGYICGHVINFPKSKKGGAPFLPTDLTAAIAISAYKVMHKARNNADDALNNCSMGINVVDRMQENSNVFNPAYLPVISQVGTQDRGNGKYRRSFLGISSVDLAAFRGANGRLQVDEQERYYTGFEETGVLSACNNGVVAPNSLVKCLRDAYQKLSQERQRVGGLSLHEIYNQGEETGVHWETVRTDPTIEKAFHKIANGDRLALLPTYKSVDEGSMVAALAQLFSS